MKQMPKTEGGEHVVPSLHLGKVLEIEIDCGAQQEETHGYCVEARG